MNTSRHSLNALLKPKIEPKRQNHFFDKLENLNFSNHKINLNTSSRWELNTYSPFAKNKSFSTTNMHSKRSKKISNMSSKNIKIQKNPYFSQDSETDKERLRRLISEPSLQDQISSYTREKKEAAERIQTVKKDLERQY